MTFLLNSPTSVITPDSRNRADAVRSDPWRIKRVLLHILSATGVAIEVTRDPPVHWVVTRWAVDVILGGHAPPLVDPLLQLGHGALPLGHPLWSCPGHKAPPQHHMIPLLPVVMQQADPPIWVSLKSTVSMVTPGYSRFVIARVGQGVVRAIAAQTIWMVTWVRGMVMSRSSSFIFTLSMSFVFLFPLFISAGGGGWGLLWVVDPIDLMVGGKFTVTFIVCLCVWVLLCLWVGCLRHHGVVEVLCGV